MKANILLLSLSAALAHAQVDIRIDGGRVMIGEEMGADINEVDINAADVSAVARGGGTASVVVGGIEGATDIQGVTVINGKVWIDGVEIPTGVSRHMTKSGKVYRITKKDGAVSVTSEEGGER